MQQEQIYNIATDLAKSKRAIDIQRALGLFESIPEYKDASGCARACKERLDLLEKYDVYKQEPTSQKNMGWIICIAMCVLVLCIAVGNIVASFFGGEKNARGTPIPVPTSSPGVVPTTKVVVTSSPRPTLTKVPVATPVPTSTTTPVETPIPTPITPSILPADIDIGEIVQFGAYEQDAVLSNGKEAIEWIVLDKQDDKALLISKYGLDTQAYHFEYNYVTWQSCSLRTWLNHQFYTEAFTFAQQHSILPTQLKAENDSTDGRDDEDTIMDRVFLLSREEAERYFAGDEARKLLVTSYARKKGAGTTYTNTAYWWLRSSGSINLRAANITLEGALGDSVVDHGSYAVRPAMWVTLDRGEL